MQVGQPLFRDQVCGGAKADAGGHGSPPQQA